ncbi:MAG TPA: transposase [Myxococcales bacterium]|nr:transposase [Myxococcales bacterium]
MGQAASRQLALKLPSRRGGKRPGAGRKPKGRRALVSHHGRPRFEKPTAVQVTLRVAGHVWNLRSRRCFETIETCLAEARERFGFRVIEFTVLGNHLHMVVEADDDEALSRGMQGLNIRIAKALNRLMKRKGRVFADHYHSRLLRSPTELVNAIAYVLGNAAHHYGESGPDRFSSRAYETPQRSRILSHPRSWLLRSGWRRARLVPQWLAKNSWPPPWTKEHRPDGSAHRIDDHSG